MTPSQLELFALVVFGVTFASAVITCVWRMTR